MCDYTTDEKTVSIPLWFDSNTDIMLTEKKYTDVSIPLWFDSNITAQNNCVIYQMSQFHYGSIQINEIRR